MGDEATEAEVQEAVEMGFVPKEDFKGNPDNWVDATVFLKRGREVMPILKKNNERLNVNVQQLSGEVKNLKGLLKTSQEAIEGLKEFNTSISAKKVEEIRAELLTSIKQSRADGDVDSELIAVDELTRLGKAKDDSEGKGKKADEKLSGATKEDETDYTQTEWWKSWTAENPWFGASKRKTALAMGIAEELREADPNLKGRALLDKMTEEVDKVFGNTRRDAPNKVEGSRGGSGRKSGNTYNDLPQEAKDACDKQGRKLVGEGKAFKDQDSWRKHYAVKYYEEDQK